jgi:hypothetical protein
MQGLLLALEKKLEGEVAVAKANIEVYIGQSVGIGEHPDLVGAIEEQLVKLAEAEEKLETLQKHFLLPDEFMVTIHEDPILV